MRILGIDPGLGSTGVGVIEKHADVWKMVTCNEVKTASTTALPKRLKKINDLVAATIQEFEPNAVAVEGIFFAKNVKSAVLMAHGRGVALLAVSSANIPVHEYSALEIKQSVVGKGRATKEQVMQMVTLILQLKSPPKSDHMADALACALAHAYRKRVSEQIAKANGKSDSAEVILSQRTRRRKSSRRRG